MQNSRLLLQVYQPKSRAIRNISDMNNCPHYKRACQVLANCCNKWVDCRLCHNDQYQDHEIDRFKITTMRCNHCSTEQPCNKECIECNQQMADYFCKVCNLFDDDGAKKKIFHCDDCGICRVGGREAVFHCDTCGGCYANALKGNHKCIANVVHQECTICLEPMFASLDGMRVMSCGHALHLSCAMKAVQHSHFNCPICRAPMYQLNSDIISDTSNIISDLFNFEFDFDFADEDDFSDEDETEDEETEDEETEDEEDEEED